MIFRFLLTTLLSFVFLQPLLAQDMVIYDDARQNSWEAWGWATTINYANPSPVNAGTFSISVTGSNYEALYLHHPAFNPSAYQSLKFWIRPTTSGTKQVQVVGMLNNAAAITYGLSFTAGQVGQWQQVTIPLTSLGVANNATFDGLLFQNASGGTMTFYLDDISLVANPPPNPVVVTVQPSSVVRTVDRRLFGMNIAIWDNLLQGPATAGILENMDTQVLRIPGGSSSDNYNWQTNRSVVNGTFQWRNSVAALARIAEARGAQAYVVVNYGSGTPEQAAAWVAYYNGSASNSAPLGTDAKGRNWQTVGYWAAMRGAAPLNTDDGYNFLRMAHPAPFGFKYWEIGNECYGSWEYDEHGVPGSGLTGVAHDAYTYAQYFKNFFMKMLSVDPSIRIGAVGITGQDNSGNGTHAVPNPNEGNSLHSGWTPVVLATLKSLAITPHFLVHHGYAQSPGSEGDAYLLQAGANLATDAANLRKMVTDYVGGSAGAEIELALTELNSVYSDPGKQSTSLVNGLFMADAMGQLTRTEFNACQWWALRNGSNTTNNNSASLYGWRNFGDYGVVASDSIATTNPNTPFPTFYAAKLLTKWARGGDRVVTATSNYNPLSPHAARLADGSLALLVVNKHPSVDLTGQITLTGFTPGSTTAALYSYGKSNDLADTDLTVSTETVSGPTFTHTFPSYSMNVLVVKSQFGAWRAKEFSASELSNWSISGDSGQPAKDGVSNLMKYALGLDPQTPATTGLPVTGKTSISGKTYQTITFTKQRALTDVTYDIQVSTNMTTWQSGPSFTVRMDNGSTDTAIYRDVIAIEDAPRRFLRLNVARSTP